VDEYKDAVRSLPEVPDKVAQFAFDEMMRAGIYGPQNTVTAKSFRDFNAAYDGFEVQLKDGYYHQQVKDWWTNTDAVTMSGQFGSVAGTVTVDAVAWEAGGAFLRGAEGVQLMTRAGRLLDDAGYVGYSSPIGRVPEFLGEIRPPAGSALGETWTRSVVPEGVPPANALIRAPVVIEFPASGLTATERQLFASHLAEQQNTLNWMSTFHPEDLRINLQNYDNIQKQINSGRRSGRLYSEGSGAGMDAAHGLDVIAGGNPYQIIGFRDPVQQRIGALWRTRRDLIQPTREHVLVPKFD
jgi:hypothetical protein